MKILLFFMFISHSLSEDNFPRPTLPQNSFKKGCRNEPKRIISPPGRRYSNAEREEENPSCDSGSTSHLHSFDGTETTGEHPGVVSTRGDDYSRYATNPSLRTSNVEYQGSCSGKTDGLHKWLSSFGQVSSDGSHCDSACTTDNIAPKSEIYVEGDSKAGPYPNIPSAKSSDPVHPKIVNRRMKSENPSSDNAGHGLSLCSVPVGKSCQPRSSCKPKNYLVPVTNEGCNQECASSDPIIDESLRNFVAAVDSLQSLLPAFDDHFGNLPQLRLSLTRKRLQSSFDLLLGISHNLRAMAKLVDTVAPETFRKNVRLMKLLVTMSELTGNLGVYVIENHDVEGSPTRLKLMHRIMSHFRSELIALLESACPVVNYFQDLSRMNE